jgi:hypothetical protein
MFLQAQTTKQAMSKTLKPEFKGYIDSFLAKTISTKDEVQDSLMFELYVYLHTRTKNELEEIQTKQYALAQVLKYNNPNMSSLAYLNLAYSYRLTNDAENLLTVEWAVM